MTSRGCHDDDVCLCSCVFVRACLVFHVWMSKSGEHEQTLSLFAYRKRSWSVRRCRRRRRRGVGAAARPSVRPSVAAEQQTERRQAGGQTCARQLVITAVRASSNHKRVVNTTIAPQGCHAAHTSVRTHRHTADVDYHELTCRAARRRVRDIPSQSTHTHTHENIAIVHRANDCRIAFASLPPPREILLRCRH